MKILVLSGDNLEVNLTTFIKEHSPSLIITLGNLNPEDITVLKTLRSIPKIGVYGNSCNGTYMNELGIWNMHLKLWDYLGFRFGGFEGAIGHRTDEERFRYSQHEAVLMLDGYPKVDIFISHYPPYGVNDLSEDVSKRGFMAMREYLDRVKPKVWIHDHMPIDQNNEVFKVGNTRIEHVSGHKLINI
jgi:uncharacterized protein